MGDIPNTHIRDYQRKRVYKAEDSCLFWGDTQIMTREQVEDVVYKISQWAEIKPPKITEDGHEITYATKDKISFTKKNFMKTWDQRVDEEENILYNI